VVNKCTFNDHDTCALVWYVKNNTSNTYSGDWQWQCRTWSHCASKKVCQQLRTVGSYSVAVHKPFITKINAHLRVQWCKNHRHCPTEMWGEMIWSFFLFSTIQMGECTCSIHQENQERAGCLTSTVKGGSVILWGHCPGRVWLGRVTARSEWLPLSYDHLMVLKMWIKCYGLCSHQISIQLNTNVRLLDT